MATPARVAVFDIGNVLITWDRRLLYAPMFASAVELEHFLNEVYSLEANQRFDRGQSLSAFTEQLAHEHPYYADQILALRERWIETIGPVIDGTVAILAELREASVPLYALSNWNADTFALVEPRHEFFGWFVGIVLSGREGLVKPEPAIYELLCARHGFAPEEALFIDDVAANVDAARAFGMDAVQFTTPGALRAALVAKRLLQAR